MKLPAFQFYVGDWMKDPNLRRCTKAEKGMWIDMLCLLFECGERGVFITDDRAWTREEIAESVGGDVAANLQLLDGLLTKGVAKIDKRGAIFSSRMIRDEQIRRNKAEAGKAGMAARWDNRTDNRPITERITEPITKRGSSASASVSSSDKSYSLQNPSLQEWLAHASLIGYEPKEAETSWRKLEGFSWEWQGNKIHNWKEIANVFKTRNQEYVSKEKRRLTANGTVAGTNIRLRATTEEQHAKGF